MNFGYLRQVCSKTPTWPDCVLDHLFLGFQAMMLLTLAEIKLNHAEKDARPLPLEAFTAETREYHCITPT